MEHQGQYLAELPRHYHALRGPFLQWAKQQWDVPLAATLGNFRRALIGWYEARIDPDDPYRGDTEAYLREVATVYFNGTFDQTALEADRLPLTTLGLTEKQHPLNHLPRPVHLNERQQLMLRQFQEMGTVCRELLLMADYHRLPPARVAEVLGVDGQLHEVAARRSKCHLLVREGWMAAGLTDPALQPSPLDEQLIDQYYAGQLDTTRRWDVEARRPGDPVLRNAMELREDWAGVITVAGRQDLMETLLREEQRYAARRQKAASRAKRIKLSPRKRTFSFGNLTLPTLETVTGVILFCVLGWLVYNTFGEAAPEQKSVTYFEPYPNIFERYAPRNEDERDLQRILYYYDRKDYLSAYDELLPVAPAYPAAPLYLGVSALALGQPARALDWLVQIDESNYYHQPAEWYEALAYLAEGRKPAALTLLREISETPGHPFRDRAVRLVGEL